MSTTLRGITHAAAIAVALAALLAVAGCAGLVGLEKSPRVSLVSIKPVQIQLLEQRYLATLRIQNPNPVALPIEGLDYSISINGEDFANGVSNEGVTVPAYGEATLEVSVTSTLAALIDQLRHFDGSGDTLRYGITGTLGITGIPGGLSFERDGEIDLRPEPAGRAV